MALVACAALSAGAMEALDAPVSPRRGRHRPPARHPSPDRSSRSPSAPEEHSDSDNSSDHTASQHIAASQDNSATSIPDAKYDYDWSGMNVVKLSKCEHGRHAVLKKCWGGKNTGRRFLGCPIEEELAQCQFVEWLDEPWSERAQDSFKQLWKDVKELRRIEARVTEALLGAININDEATRARVALQEEVNRTKRVAQRICATYQRKAVIAAVDKNKLMYLIYCLLGVIVFLVAAFLFTCN